MLNGDFQPRKADWANEQLRASPGAIPSPHHRLSNQEAAALTRRNPLELHPSNL
jgi:hypothetical protein